MGRLGLSQWMIGDEVDISDDVTEPMTDPITTVRALLADCDRAEKKTIPAPACKDEQELAAKFPRWGKGKRS